MNNVFLLRVPFFDTCLATIVFGVLLCFSINSNASRCLDRMKFAGPYYGSYAPDPKGTLTAKDRASIEALEQTTPLDIDSKWETVSQIYYKARIKNVPDEGLKFLRERWVALKPKYANLDNIYAGSTGIFLPIELRGTPLPAIFRAHEFEHAIQVEAQLYAYQNKLLIGMTPSSLDNILFQMKSETINFRRLFDPLWVYQSERIAMEAEWEPASAVTVEESRRTYEIINSLKMDEEIKQTLRRMLVAATFSKTQYVEIEHSHDRHEIEQSLQVVAPQWTSLYLLTKSRILRTFGSEQ